jgi:protein arginine kinase activator
MKCEHCGKNEVTFMYRSSVNGNVTEQHLCGECAEKLGYTRAMAARNRSMMQSFFGKNSLFDDFFSPGLMGRSRWLLEDPFDDFFSEMPALRSAARQETEEPRKQQNELVDHEEQNRFSRMRQVNALRMEMKRAVGREDFEQAAQLRDEIRALEADESK